MKNLMLGLFVMIAMVMTNGLQAQTACTPAQKAACKKICADQTKCTPEQMAACKKACAGKVASANAVKVVNQAPEKKATCNKPCTQKAGATAEASANTNPVKLVGLDLLALPEVKEKKCSQPCAAKAKLN